MTDVANLKRALRQSSEAWARENGVGFYSSKGTPGTLLFQGLPDNSGHGNFEPGVWAAICADDGWYRRTRKPHSQRGALPEPHCHDAFELDSSNSSDALLMNCFCRADARQALKAELFPTIDVDDVEFGFSARVPLLPPRDFDETEVDLRLGKDTFEAKLTESSFTSKRKDVVERYRDLRKVFDIGRLPQDQEQFHGYQLIRNVLAAAQGGGHFTVLIDQRRPDLRKEWDDVRSAIVDRDVAARCGLRTWQEVAAACPVTVRSFLAQKYGL